MAEVTLGKMATQQAANEDVKKFGQRMVDEHGKANEELKKLATSEGVTLPTELDPEAKALQQRLGKLSGAEFDRC
jgi:putative membrane protein